MPRPQSWLWGGKGGRGPTPQPTFGAIFSFLPSSQQMGQDPAQPSPPGPSCCGRAREPPPTRGAALPAAFSHCSPSAPCHPAAGFGCCWQLYRRGTMENIKHHPPSHTHRIHTPRPHLQPQGLRHPPSQPAQPCPGAPSPSPSPPGTPLAPVRVPGHPGDVPLPGAHVLWPRGPRATCHGVTAGPGPTAGSC